MRIIGNSIMAGASGPSGSIFVTGLSETDSVTAAHKKTVQVPNPDYVGLPDEYTQLEYIESTGTQYIDLGYSTSNAATLAKMSFEVTCAYYDIETGSTAELLNGNGNAYLGFSAGKFYASWGRDAGILTDSNIVSDSLMHTWLVDTDEKAIKFDDTIVESDVNFTGVANSYGALYLFGYQPSSLNNCRIASAKLKYNNEYVRNLVSAKRNSDNVIGLYDLANNVFYTNAGTGTFTAGSEIPQYIETTIEDKTLIGKWTQKPNPLLHGLPDGYTELEYIESTGTQWIDSKYIPQTGDTASIVFQPTVVVSNTESWVFSIFYGCQWRAGLSGTTFYSNDGFSYDQVSSPTAITTATGTCPGNASGSVCLFAQRESGGVYYYNSSKHKLFSCTVYRNGLKVVDFIPAKRKSDGVIGLYDSVRNLFFGNSGTGEFVAGPEIPQTFDGFMIKPIRSLGTWTVMATDGSHTKTQDVLVDAITDYEIELSYILWLYREGDECKDITGGYVDKTNNSSYGYFKKQSNYLEMGCSSASYYYEMGVSKDFPIAGYTKAYVDLQFFSGSYSLVSYSRGLFGIGGKSTSFSYGAHSGIDNQNLSTNRTVLELDISEATETHLSTQNIVSLGANGQIKVYRIWLE